MIYLDNAATSYPKPPGVLCALARAVTELGGNPGRSAHKLSLLAAEAIYETREKVAALLGAPHPENIVFTENATYALNMAIKSFVRPGMHLLISSREHNAVLRPVIRLAKEGIITYDVFDAEASPEEGVVPLLKKETALLILNLVSNVDGLTVNLASHLRCARLHRFSVLLDASQALGHLPLPLGRMGFFEKNTPLFALCAPCHKGLFGVQGAGFAYFTSPPESTFIEGGSGASSLSPTMPETLPERMEAGTLPTPAIIAAGAGIDFINEVGVGEIEEKTTTLTNLAIERLSCLKRITLHLPKGRRSGGILSFTVEGLPPETIAAHLDKKGIAVRAGLHCAPLAHKAIGTLDQGTIRASFGYYNSAENVERLFYELKEILER